MERIVIVPGLCGNRPVVRGTRIRVQDVLEMLASGMTGSQILEDFPDLHAADIPACLAYAARQLR